MLEELAHDGVAALVIGGELLCAVAHDLALLLRAHLDLADGLLDLVGGDEALAVRDGHERGLVEQVLEVGAREAGRAAGNGVEVHIVRERLAPGVDLEYGLAAADVGQADIHAAVEAAGAGQGVVEDVVTVRGGHYDDALVVREAVHLDEQLVEGLLALVVSAAEAGAALAADGVYLVYEDDGRGHLLGLVEEVAHAGGADADIELHEVGAGYRQELHARLAGDGLGYERLACARRADEQHALGYARAHLGVRARVLEEVHDLLQLRLLLVAAGHVGKRDLLLLLAAEAGAGLAELADARRAAASGLVHHIVPEREHAADEQQVRDHADPPGGHEARLEVIVLYDPLRVLLVDGVHHLVEEIVHAEELVAHRGVRGGRVHAALGYHDLGAGYDKGLYLLFVEEVHNVGIDHLLSRARGGHGVDHGEENDHDEHIKTEVTGPVSLRFQLIFTSFGCYAV